MRRALAAAVPVLAVLALPAGASPSAGPEQGRLATFEVTAGSSSFVVDVLATTPAAGGTPRVRVLVTDTAAHELRRLEGSLPSSALTTAGGVTTLRARLGAAPLTVAWRSETGAVALDAGRSSSDGSEAHGWTIAGTGGSADVRLGTVHCRVGGVIVGPVVAFDTSGYGRPLAAGLGRSLRGARCGDVPSSTPPVP